MKVGEIWIYKGACRDARTAEITSVDDVDLTVILRNARNEIIEEEWSIDANSSSFIKLKEEAMWADKTVEAIKKSKMHWDEIEQMLKDGKPTSSLSTGSESCALCKLAGFYSVEDVEKCHKCPLGIRGFLCINEESPYKIFMANKTPENARNMVLALKSLFYPEEEKKEVFYSIGQRFINTSGTYVGDEYILCRHNSEKIQLTHLPTGERWSSPEEAKDDRKITESEFKKLSTIARFKLKESK